MRRRFEVFFNIIEILNQKINGSRYSLIRTLQPFNNGNAVCGLIFINENGFDTFLVVRMRIK